MNEHKVPVRSLIDHIKTATDVDPWAKEMVEELLKEQEPKQVVGIADSIEGMEVGYCPSCDRAIVNKKIDETKFCKFCGQRVSWKGSEME